MNKKYFSNAFIFCLVASATSASFNLAARDALPEIIDTQVAETYDDKKTDFLILQDSKKGAGTYGIELRRTSILLAQSCQSSCKSNLESCTDSLPESDWGRCEQAYYSCISRC